MKAFLSTITKKEYGFFLLFAFGAAVVRMLIPVLLKLPLNLTLFADDSIKSAFLRVMLVVLLNVIGILISSIIFYAITKYVIRLRHAPFTKAVIFTASMSVIKELSSAIQVFQQKHNVISVNTIVLLVTGLCLIHFIYRTNTRDTIIAFIAVKVVQIILTFVLSVVVALFGSVV